MSNTQNKHNVVLINAFGRAQSVGMKRAKIAHKYIHNLCIFV